MNDKPGKKFNDENAEQKIIGACLKDRQSYWLVADKLKPDDFSITRHVKIWQTMQAVGAQGKDTTRDFVIVYSDGADSTLPAYLAKLQVEAEPEHLQEFLGIVKHLSAQRKILTDIEAFRRNILKVGIGQPLEVTVAASIAKITGTDFGDNKNVKSIDVWAMEQARKVEAEFRKGENGSMGHRCGLRAVDEVIGTCLPGRLIVLGGLSSMGKSALMQKIIKGLAFDELRIARLETRAPRNAYINSLEMMGADYASREMARITGIAANKIDEGNVNADDVEQIINAALKLREYKHIIIDDKSKLNIDALYTKWYAHKQKYGMFCAVVDHILLMQGAKGENGIMDKVSNATIGLKDLAKELGIFVIALGQLKNDIYNRENKRPTINDLFGGATIDQNADAVFFIHRPEIFLMRDKPAPNASEEIIKNYESRLEPLKGRVEIINGKRRGGARGEVRTCRFIPETMDFQDT